MLYEACYNLYDLIAGQKKIFQIGAIFFPSPQKTAHSGNFAESYHECQNKSAIF